MYPFECVNTSWVELGEYLLTQFSDNDDYFLSHCDPTWFNCYSLLDLIAVLPIHLVTVVSTAVFLRHILPTDVSLVALEPIEYSDGANPWIVVSLSTPSE